MAKDDEYRFTMNGRGGRSGTITYHEADRRIEIGWEALLDPPGSIWMELLLGEWTRPEGAKIDEKRRLMILKRLHQWLEDQGIRTPRGGFSLLRLLREEIVPEGVKNDLERQLRILRRLRQWLTDQGIPSDLDLPAETETTARRCAWRDCRERSLRGSAYCPRHYDLNLLGALNEPIAKGVRLNPSQHDRGM